MPATQPRRWTAAAVRRLIADNPLHTPRYELVDGELLVTPSPARRHQVALRELFLALHPFVQEQGIGEILWSPSDVELEPESVLQPDLFIMAPDEAARPTFPVRSLVLAIEVLSPSSASHDRGRKRLYYQRNGVSEYWLVDLDAHVVERWRPGDARAERSAETLDWQPAGASRALSVDLRAVWMATPR